jgi:hypothetical protein
MVPARPYVVLRRGGMMLISSHVAVFEEKAG